MPDPIVAYVEFVGGAMRPVYEEPSGRQYVYDNDGERVYGVWFIPREKCDRPTVAPDKASDHRRHRACLPY
jgi:hypothetical protein